MSSSLRVDRVVSGVPVVRTPTMDLWTAYNDCASSYWNSHNRALVDSSTSTSTDSESLHWAGTCPYWTHVTPGDSLFLSLSLLLVGSVR